MNDMVRAFEAALSPPARRRLERDPAMTLLIERCITGGWSVDMLADVVGYGVLWGRPANARDVMIYRLRKAAGDETEEEE